MSILTYQFGPVTDFLPDVSAAGISNFFFWLLVFVGVTGAICTGLFFFVRRMQFNKKIIILENVAGLGYRPTRRDRAMLIKIGDQGEEILRLRKNKVYRPAYGKKMGVNEYWFAIGADGYWYNVTMSDLDESLGEVGVMPVDRDMRYMHVAIRRNTEKKYGEKITFLQKYGGMLVFLSLVVVTGVMWWLILKDSQGAVNAAADAVRAAADVNKETARLLGSLDTIVTGSGVR